jgi:hypothetical protein
MRPVEVALAFGRAIFSDARYGRPCRRDLIAQKPMPAGALSFQIRPPAILDATLITEVTSFLGFFKGSVFRFAKNTRETRDKIGYQRSSFARCSATSRVISSSDSGPIGEEGGTTSVKTIIAPAHLNFPVLDCYGRRHFAGSRSCTPAFKGLQL